VAGNIDAGESIAPTDAAMQTGDPSIGHDMAMGVSVSTSAAVASCPTK